MEQVKAVIHSLDGRFDDVNILHHLDEYKCIAEYKGVLYKAMYIPLSGCYYVDDKYGEIVQR